MIFLNRKAQDPWNKDKLVDQKKPLFKLIEIWAIRIRLQISARIVEIWVSEISTNHIRILPINTASYGEGYRPSGRNVMAPWQFQDGMPARQDHSALTSPA